MKDQYELSKIKHMTSPLGDTAVGAVGQYLEHLIPAIKEYPAMPDEAGRDVISVEHVLKIIDTLFDSAKESWGSFDYDRYTGERVEE